MKFKTRYILPLSLVLVAIAFIVGYLQYMTLAYLLLFCSFSVLLIQHYLINQRVNKLHSLFPGNQARDADVIVDAGLHIGILETQMNNIAVALSQLQNDKINELADLQVDGKVGEAMYELRSKLKAMKEEEEKQNWIVKGVALIGEIRKTDSSNSDFAYLIVSTLVKYMEANQGAFYLLHDVDGKPAALELMATYAYDKRKYSYERIVVDTGTGLLGQCVLERDIMFLTQVPKDYVKITSGLGEATPRCITILPLIFRDLVYGVIEIASFQVYEQYHLNFLKRISVRIASELAGIIQQDHTTLLLQQSQQQAVELKSQEEELRQNMEEMRTAQETVERVKEEMNAQLKVLDEVMAISKMDTQGKITYVNEMFIQNTLYSRAELIGQNHNILKPGLMSDQIYKDLWDTIASGKTWTGELVDKAKDGTLRYVETIISPLFDPRGVIVEYLSARFPIDERIKREAEMKEKEIQLQEQLRQVQTERKKNQAILEGCVDGVISFDDTGTVQFFNRAAEEIFGLSRMEVMNLPVTKILDLHIVENEYNNEDKKIITETGNEINIRTEVNACDKTGNEISLLLTSTKVKLGEATLFTLFAQKISVDLF